MIASLYAIGILAQIAVTVLLCIRLGTPSSRPRWRAGLLTGAACGLAYFLSPGHLCDRGNPTLQVLIGSVCIVSLVLRIRTGHIAAGLAVAAAAATLGLAMGYLRITHSTGLTGNPSPSEPRRMARALESAERFLTEAGAKDKSSYPEGWLHETEFFKSAPQRPDGDRIPTHASEVKISWLWHSWFSGIFERRSRSVALWFPGGTPADAAKRLEWRERPRKE